MIISKRLAFHCLLHFVDVAPEAISHNLGFLSNIFIAESTTDSLAHIVLFSLSYNPSEHAFAQTYQATAPLQTQQVSNPEDTDERFSS